MRCVIRCFQMSVMICVSYLPNFFHGGPLTLALLAFYALNGSQEMCGPAFPTFSSA